MAVTGTIKQARDNYRGLLITILGVTDGSSSPNFRAQGVMAYGSYTAQGTFGATPTTGLYGSNDGGTTWFVVGSTFTAAQAGALIGANGEIFQSYQFQTSGGSGSSLNFYVYLASAFG